MLNYNYLEYNDLFLSYFSKKWFANYSIGDSEEICPEYLEAFETYLDNAYIDRSPLTTSEGTYLFDCRVDSYEFNGNTVSVKCSADYDMTYYCVYDAAFGAYVYVVGGTSIMPYLAVTNKTDGSLVHIGKIKDVRLNPEHKYNSHGMWPLYDEEYPLDDDLHRIMDTGKGINYTCTTNSEFSVTLPEIYDAEKHDLSIWFRITTRDYDYGDTYYTSNIEKQIYNPFVLVRDDIPEPEPPVVEPPTPEVVRGDADGDGILNLSDVTATLKYLAEWENIVIDETAADTDGNGSVNLTDVSFMLQLIAGWNV